MPVSEQGLSQTRYMIVPRTLIFLTCRDQILLLKGAPSKRLWANQYNGIGGHVERGEDVLLAARRELAEEAGLDDVNLWLCGMVMIDTGDFPGIGIFIFRGECPAGELIDSEEGQLEWVPFAELYHRPLVKDLKVLLPELLKLERGDPPVFARYSYGPDGKLLIRFGEKLAGEVS